MSTVQILRDAKKLISQGGWVKRNLKSKSKGRDGNVAYCIMGAIETAVGVPQGGLRNSIHDLSFKYQDGVIAAVEVAYECLPDDKKFYYTSPEAKARNLMDYNDISAKSEKDILAIFDCAIKKAK